MSLPTSDLRTVLPAPGVVAVLRTQTASEALEMADALRSGGVTVLEVTTSIPEAEGVVRRLAQHDDVVVGAGTVTAPAQLHSMLEAGARFIVSPGIHEGVLDAGLAAGVPVVPGVLTPSEVIRARGLGATTLKLFPAGTVGPGHLEALRSVFPGTGFIPTGGVDAANIGRWLEAGSVAVGVGSILDRTYRRQGARALEALATELVGLMPTTTVNDTIEKEHSR